MLEKLRTRYLQIVRLMNIIYDNFGKFVKKNKDDLSNFGNTSLVNCSSTKRTNCDQS